jgi:circadian clock protein KaiC
MERVKTGINGLDPLINGGFPKGHTILVSGQAGAGKTIFGLQYLIHGAKLGEKGVFISFEESIDELIQQSSALGLNLKDFEKSQKIRLLAFNPNREHLKSINDKILAELGSFSPSRIVFDSISTYGVYAETLTFFEMLLDYGVKKDNINFSAPESVLRRAVMGIMDKLKNFGATTVLISELPETSNYLSRDTVSEFLADGVILLKHIPIGDALNRSIEIRKLRHSAMVEGTHSYSIGKNGLTIDL